MVYNVLPDRKTHPVYPQAIKTQARELYKMQDGQQDTAGLKMLAEKTMRTPSDPRYMAYCPTMPLLALATVDDQVHVFRTNGQRVFGVSKKESTDRLAGIRWKPDGRYITVEGLIDCIC